MENLVCKGLVIRQTNYGEADRILTIFTEELGVVQAMAKGARRYRSHQGPAAQFLCYGQFQLHSGKTMYALRGATPIETFYGLGSAVEKLALATYLCDITQALVQAENREPQALSLLLNTLYLLARKERPLPLVKAVYELRILALSGFEPEMRRCVKCGKEETPFFSIREGGAVCSSCAAFAAETRQLSADGRAAISHILSKGVAQIYSFNLSQPAAEELSALAEAYLLAHLEREFASLRYFHQIMP